MDRPPQRRTAWRLPAFVLSTHELFASARIAWAYDTFGEFGYCVTNVAELVGYASAASPQRQCVGISGMRFTMLGGASSVDAAQILVTHLMKPNIGERDKLVRN